MEWLIHLKDESVISKLKTLKSNTTTSSDWADAISDTEQLMIKAGLKDLEKGNTFTHEQVMKEINDIYDM
jgi:predicted transcriptional regulator